MKNDLAKIKEKIVNRILLLLAILMTPVYITSVIRILKIGWIDANIWYACIYLYLLFSAIFRRKLSTAFKIGSISLLYLSVSFIGLYNFSFGGGFIGIIMAIAILSILLERKVTMVFTGIIFILFSLFAWGFSTGYLTPKVDLNVLSQTPSHWVTRIVAVFSIIVIFVYCFGDFYHELIISLKKNKANELKYRLLFEEANDAIILLKDAVIFDCNEKTCDYFKNTRKALVGKATKDISPEYQSDGQNSEDKAKELIRLTMQGFPQQYEWKHIKSNGELFDLSISLNKIELFDEVYIQAILRDITNNKKREAELERYRLHLENMVAEKTKDLEAALEEWKSLSEQLTENKSVIERQNNELKTTLQHLKETQSQLIQSEKMASLGILTAGVAHEINNPLNYIMGGYCGLMNMYDKSGEKNEKTQKLLGYIKTGVDRATGIISGLNQFSSYNDSVKEPINLHEIINNCLLILNKRLSPNIHVDKEFTPETFNVLGNSGKMHQVIVNALNNSIMAIKGHGIVEIKTLLDKKRVKLYIKDTGEGIAESNLTKVFEPFFTTRDPGEGIGLGLSIAFTIIKEHNGTINLQSEQGKGTEVLIELPVI